MTVEWECKVPGCSAQGEAPSQEEAAQAYDEHAAEVRHEFLGEVPSVAYGGPEPEPVSVSERAREDGNEALPAGGS